MSAYATIVSARFDALSKVVDEPVAFELAIETGNTGRIGSFAVDRGCQL